MSDSNYKSCSNDGKNRKGLLQRLNPCSYFPKSFLQARFIKSVYKKTTKNDIKNRREELITDINVVEILINEFMFPSEVINFCNEIDDDKNEDNIYLVIKYSLQAKDKIISVLGNKEGEFLFNKAMLRLVSLNKIDDKFISSKMKYDLEQFREEQAELAAKKKAKVELQSEMEAIEAIILECKILELEELEESQRKRI